MENLFNKGLRGHNEDTEYNSRAQWHLGIEMAKRKRRHPKKTRFNPSHEYVEAAMDVYMKGGGTITRLEVEA